MLCASVLIACLPARQSLGFETRTCLDNPPPVFREVVLLGSDAGCPVEVCIEMDSAKTLAADVDALLRYADEAWILCGKRDAGK